jgi:tetratricopeptide (TPR) repeat protein
VERVLAEATAGTEVQHPTIVRMLDFGVGGNGVDAPIYLVFEAVSGQTLRGVLDDVGPLSDSRVREIGAEIADALAAIHARGLVHGDVKPENVIHPDDGTVRLLDFGAARPTRPSGDAEAGTFVGSLLYAAPEQLATGPDPIDGRADLYALGLLLYELVTGRHPCGRARFPDDPGGSRPAPRDARLSPFLACVVDDLIALERCDRLASADQLCELLNEGEKSAYWRRRSHRRDEPKVMPMRGRDAELAVLREAVGEGRSVLVEGVPGIGKSRLIDEFSSRSDARLVLRGSFAEGNAIALALRPYVATGGLPLDERAVATLEAYVGGESPAIKPSIPELQTNVARLISTWSRERPVLVVIDDLHLADADGLALFASIARIEEPRVAVIGATRPELPDAWRDGVLAHGSVTALGLEPLSPDTVRELVTDLLGGTPSDRLTDWCTDHCQGHPLLAREAIRWIRTEDGRLNDAGDSWDLLGDLAAVPPSDSVREIVRARLDRLPVPVRDLLDAAACGGLQFDMRRLAVALGTTDRALHDRLTRIEAEHGAVMRSGEGFAFEHQTIREVLHEDLHPALRRELHAAWSDALRASADEVDGATAVSLVSHLLEAGRSESALDLIEDAVAHLEQSVRPHAALGLIERVLDGLQSGTAEERVPLLRKRAERLLRLGRLEPFDSTMREAWSLADGVGALERTRLHDLNAKRGLMARDTGTVQSEVEKAFALTAERTDAPPALMAALTHNLADVAWFDCRAVDAHDLFVRAAELAHAGDDLDLECRMRAMAAYSHVLTAPPERSIRECEQADRLASAYGPAAAQAFGRLVLAVALGQMGRNAESRKAHGEARELCNRAGNRAMLVSIEIHLAHVLVQQGEFAAARDRTESALKMAEELGMPGLVGASENGIAEVLAALGEFEQADAWFLKSVRRMRRLGAKSGIEAISRIATMRASLGRHRESLRIYEHVAPDICDNQLWVTQAAFRVAFAQACLAAGRLERAEALACEARRCGEFGPGRPLEARALAIEAACAWQRGDPDAERRTDLALEHAPREHAALQLDVVRLGAGGWMAARRPEASARIARRVTKQTASYPAPWQRTLPLALAAREDPVALHEARAHLREYGERIPLLDRIAAHAHLWFADGDESDRTAARRLAPDIDPFVDLTRADPAVARFAV